MDVVMLEQLEQMSSGKRGPLAPRLLASAPALPVPVVVVAGQSLANAERFAVRAETRRPRREQPPMLAQHDRAEGVRLFDVEPPQVAESSSGVESNPRQPARRHAVNRS
jgi:hypothetical protein